GMRVSTIVNELSGEKIDIVEYDDDPAKFIAAALSPATVVNVFLSADGSRSCRVTVPDNQLSLAIGNRGQNARLAAKLTGWKIDIKPESGFFGEDEEPKTLEEIPSKKDISPENTVTTEE
ncbi:MAG: transcription termination/antitermination protein NusA, partial [Christensenellaceae bacterium]